jgi:DNA-binding transcriptional regulator LsrR (DeoR family)
MNDIGLMVTVSKLYYEEGSTQEKIAKELDLTRLRVIELLKRAKAEGIVQIHIVNPETDFAEMERRLAAKYGLRRVIIIPSIPDNAALQCRNLGRAASVYLNETLESRDVFGVGWGLSALATAECLQDYEKRSITAVPLIGGGSETFPQYDVNALVRRFSQVFGGDCFPLYTLALADTKAIRDAIVTDSKISRVLEYWNRLDVVLIGIGAMTVRFPDLFARHLEVEPVDFEGRDIVGDVLCRFYDIQGREIRLDFSDRMIGVNFENFRKARQAIGVAGGLTKYKAILGAVRAKIVNVLITDHDVAKRLLEQPDA